jgi:protein involved in polysaccharide export with SLBB domain
VKNRNFNGSGRLLLRVRSGCIVGAQLLLLLSSRTSIQAAAQASAQNPERPLGSSVCSLQETSQFGGNSNDQSAETPNEEFVAGAADQNSEPDNSIVADQSPGQGRWSHATMPAQQILEILQQNPGILASVKSAAAQQLEIDPATIPDQQIYQCVRDDLDFRRQTSAELEEQGFTVDIDNSRSTLQGSADAPFSQYGIPKRPQSALSQEVQSQEMRDQSPEMKDSFEPGQAINATQSRQSPSRKAPSRNQSRTEEQSNEITLKQRSIPYKNLPSLRDLYSQVTPEATRLQRFGSETFRLGTGNANQLPIDLPAGPDYVLGPGDSLVLNLWGSQSGRVARAIDRQGEIALPEAGSIVIAGQTIAQAQIVIQHALETQFQNERVEISLGRLHTVRVYVVGDVQRPGAYDLSALSTPLNALYAAGGPTSRGSLRTLKQYRGKDLVHEIDLYDFLLHGVRSESDHLQSGDTILVPPVGPQVAIGGMVRRPAIYELRGEQNLSEVLNLAGGLRVSANLNEIRVERVEAHQRHTMLSVQVADGSKDDSPNLPSFAMQDGDSVQVSPILPYNDQVVYLDGHVFRPGKYAWREGMTVNDLLHSYQDVMPEPAIHAEVIRLQPPDLHPETISFDLGDILDGSDPLTLRPFDVIRVFSRYEIDPPKVAIYGEVLRPGEYPMAQGMTVSGLLQMAGGFRRSAYRGEVDLSSYVIQGGEKVLVHHTAVAISRALDGDKAADVTLQPGDIVGVRQLTGWKDIGASVKVDGEVNFAGTYGIEEGERLSSVLKRVGGFRGDAYPAGATLQRVQVRELEEHNRQEMIHRIEATSPSVKSGLSTPQDQLSLMQAVQQQQQQVLASLRSHPSTGRLVIRISSEISKWENTSADIEMRAGDHLMIPKRPGFVLVSGQVYNATGVTFAPGRDAGWYLKRAGGVTRSGDKKEIFIVRADGSVVGRPDSMFGPTVLSTKLNPGDSVVVPEKAAGGSQFWRSLIGMAQVMSSVALTGAAVGAF